MPNGYRTKARKEIAKDLEVLMEIQCRDGNWNYDPYMHGLANGLILAHATVLGIEPKFLDSPKEWLKDKPSSDIPVAENVDTTVVKKESQSES